MATADTRLSGCERKRVADEAAMWCDLFLGHREAESARFHITRRAELYVRVAGLPLGKVLDALDIDEDGWRTRLEELRAQETRNRAAYVDRSDAARAAEQEEAP